MKNLPLKLSRRDFSALAGIGIIAPSFVSAADEAAAGAYEKLEKLTLAGPYSAVANPLIHIAESGSLLDIAQKVDFVTWNNPDQLRALAIKGGADFIAMPSNVAANLYNRGVGLKLLNISTWGILHIVSSDEKIGKLEDLRGMELVMPFRGDMPEIVFSLITEKLGIKKEEIKLRYVASPLDAMQLLLTRRAKAALLAEPAVSVGLAKSKEMPANIIAPALYKSVNMQTEWGRAFKTSPQIAQAGICAMKGVDKHVVNRLIAEYQNSFNWCGANAKSCAKLVASRVKMLTEKGVENAISASTDKVVPALKAREQIEFFFSQLMQTKPQLVGGKMPDDGFYWQQ